MKKRFQKEVDDVIEVFDFEKVHKTMQLLDWKWFHPEEKDMRVPTLDEIKKRAKEILQEAAEKAAKSKNEFVIGTGGFRAEATYYPETENEKSFLWVRLAFIVEDSDNAK